MPLDDPQTVFGSQLVAWWDARDHGTSLMTVEAGERIVSWIDRIGGLALLATSGNANRPTYGATALESLYPGVTFDGVANRLRATSTTGLPVAAAKSIILAECAPVTNATNVIFGYGDATNFRLLRWVNQSSTIRANIISASGVQVTGTQVFTANQRVWVGGYFDSTLRIRRFGDVGSTTTSTTLNTGTGTTCMGANTAASPANFLNGVISQVLVLAW